VHICSLCLAWMHHLMPSSSKHELGRTSMSMQCRPPGCCSSFLQVCLISSLSLSTCMAHAWHEIVRVQPCAARRHTVEHSRDCVFFLPIAMEQLQLPPSLLQLLIKPIHLQGPCTMKYAHTSSLCSHAHEQIQFESGAYALCGLPGQLHAKACLHGDKPKSIRYANV